MNPSAGINACVKIEPLRFPVFSRHVSKFLCFKGDSCWGEDLCFFYIFAPYPSAWLLSSTMFVVPDHEELKECNVCEKEGCQACAGIYKDLYSKYLDKVEHNVLLLEKTESQKMSTENEISLLKNQYGASQENYNVSVLMLDALQGKLPAPATKQPTCPGCINHWTALALCRERISAYTNEMRAKHANDLKMLDEYKARIAALEFEKSRLTVWSRGNDTHPWWERVRQSTHAELTAEKNKVIAAEATILALTRERDLSVHNVKVARERAETAEARLGEANYLLELNKSQIVGTSVKDELEGENRTLKQKVQELSGVEDENRALKRKLEELSEGGAAKKKKVSATLDAVLMERFIHVFTFTDDHKEEAEAKHLYDAFMSSIPPTEQEHYLELLFSACNAGEKLSSRERKTFKEGKRACKTNFHACLEAAGGICERRGPYYAWVNVRINKLE